MFSNTRGTRNENGFTLIELVIVVAILVILAAILIPSLARAREQGRITKCMISQRSLTHGVQMFADEHQGYGQLLIGAESMARLVLSNLPRYERNRYVYEVWPDSLKYDTRVDLVPSPWPVAYGQYIGAPGLLSEDYFVNGEMYNDPRVFEVVRTKRKVPVLRCPSDRFLVAAWGSPDHVLGVGSYLINFDIFGRVHPSQREVYRKVWRDGMARGAHLEGRLDRVQRPSGVLMFVDGGNGVDDGTINVGLFGSSSVIGPTLSAWARRTRDSHYLNLPGQRHSRDGALVGGFVDGHVEYIRPLGWELFDVQSNPPGRTPYLTRQRVPTRFSPDPRITPYEPGEIPSSNGSTRR